MRSRRLDLGKRLGNPGREGPEKSTKAVIALEEWAWIHDGVPSRGWWELKLA